MRKSPKIKPRHPSKLGTNLCLKWDTAVKSNPEDMLCFMNHQIRNSASVAPPATPWTCLVAPTWHVGLPSPLSGIKRTSHVNMVFSNEIFRMWLWLDEVTIRTDASWLTVDLRREAKSRDHIHTEVCILCLSPCGVKGHATPLPTTRPSPEAATQLQTGLWTNKPLFFINHQLCGIVLSSAGNKCAHHTSLAHCAHLSEKLSPSLFTATNLSCSSLKTLYVPSSNSPC